ncbi:sigma-54-dependent Fis family transcriptional regulator [Pseudomonas capeferrum]|uniref:sigma-54-dependent Fis family transcriptional regulator n=1 Tax=Pseudomonas capeferrum TaxID=1495066 RepID=UPI0015E43AE3|nr:sigma-54-dependent Fis family transcriptional regulator [Pseudomonas capeferrum]MBA1202723.1 sigma-54-dependent Fis family transcriptional regulator [Pseudomonas capeferrum]
MIAHPHATSPSELAAFIDCHFAERGIRPETVIAESWYRSINQHRLDPGLRRVDNVLSATEIRRHQAQHEAYLSIASQGVNGLAKRVVDAGFAVLLSDEQGITLDARLPAENGLYTRSGLLVGARWDESIAGTNGIGTALAAGQALTIHRQEHFLAANARLSCSVSPIFDAQGRLQGCLNATCLYNDGPKQAQHLTLQLVIMYARLIENTHFRQRYRDRLTLAIKPRDDITDLANEQLLALDESGRVIGANRAAFMAHESLARPLLGLRIEQLLPARIDELLNLTRGGACGVHLRALVDDGLLEVGLRVPAGYRQRPTPAPSLPPSAHPNLDELAGNDPQLQQDVRRLRKVLDKDIAILLTGETGTGKEAFARAVHEASLRRAGPFVALNCAAIPEALIESELFGYRPGSFTGADRKGMKGKLELANGGTLFLDEIGDMPAHLQTRLLRVLAERELVPLGAGTSLPLDIQVVSATHQDLAAMIRDKRFREDLYYRLCGMHLKLPPLRLRTDRGELIARILERQPAANGLRLSTEARAYLIGHPWPGNLRQLINSLRYASALAEGGVIDTSCLPQELLAVEPLPKQETLPAIHRPLERHLDDSEARQLLLLLRQERWNISATAHAAGISRSTLYRKMKRHGIVPPNQAG